MVSNASEDFPDPLRPVITVRVLRGISTSIFFKLCWRAPCTVIRSNICVNCEGGLNFYCDASCNRVQSALKMIQYHAPLQDMRGEIKPGPPYTSRAIFLYGRLRMPQMQRGQSHGSAIYLQFRTTCPLSFVR